MPNAMFHYLMLTSIVFLKTVLFVGGHGMCVSNVNIYLESNKYFKSFMQLDTIGVLQCMKVCKRYKLCERIHHNREQLTCELMMPYAEEGNMPSLFDVQSVQFDSSNCSRDSCSETEVCVERRDDSHVCQGLCPKADWVPFIRKCYFFSESQMTAADGEVFCNSSDATLVRIDNAEENAFLVSEMTKRGIPVIWLAANDRAVEGEWVWGPGDVVLNAIWGSNEPDNINNEDCGILQQNTETWHDLSCDSIRHAVCQLTDRG
ncbi:aggrecan core protein-like [Pecten maximus]|uniref:aggrecan core protein-like n=1 Tax=Pecten maximus TaxID=6579 RepID=UPI001458EE77|nr:aggrecan core protein-like [Pecten maximus]